jgi:osmotically-inducible protein OsmY
MKTLKANERPQRATLGRWSAILLMAAGMQVLIVPSLSAASMKMEITDNGVSSAVESDLRLDPAVSHALIQAQVSQGIVTLTGSVNDLPARRRAVRIAESVRGVLGVIDQITVTPEARPDEDIRKDILAALLNDPATESYQVAASVQDAVVTLTGSVGSWAESQLAQRIAEGVKGVKDIHNDISVNYAAQRSDEEMTADIQAVLHWDIWLEGDPLQVTVKNGVVALTGTVGSAIAKTRAGWDAWVNGVLSVDSSGVKVDPAIAGKERRRHESDVRSDGEIKKAVELSFRNDPRLAHNTINVRVEDGIVILSGAVTHLKAEASAAQDARDIIGVSWVDNQLLLQPDMSWPADAEVQKGLNAALTWDPRLAGTQIEAAVINHVAYLGGDVDSVQEKAEAQDVASRTRGVVEVRNHLRVAPESAIFFYDQPDYDFETFGAPPPKSDPQIKKAIEHAFFWSPFVHRDDITVTVDNGVAKLTGTVGSWIGYEEAYQDARHSGAVDVINRLNVN